MEAINDLLRQLNNDVPSSIYKRLDGLKKLREKLAVAEGEHEENPTEESQEKLSEIVEFLNDTEEDLVDDLQELVDKKKSAEREKIAKRQEQERIAKRQEQERIAKEEEEILAKKQKEEKEKKSGVGLGGLILGGALLVLSAGAINYFGKR
jgi:hypothetical protein